jgi:hypothetical protein
VQKALAYAILKETAENIWTAAVEKADKAKEYVCGAEIL